MSVLNQSGEEQQECPLCMEPLEVDDLNFYPCTCGYQICRFCWHRIRTDENGLCPACRKAYSENPADFIPLSQEQVAKLKAEKRQRDQQRKAKLSESRKHLASVRVVQRNLVFVVGLPVRLADAEILRRHEYFGKFGKIHKVVINQSTSYAGSQGPSASAYVTYVKSDDALRAIQSVNNITLDGRQIKSSLGTTKYCSHFMKNQPCPKPDCMYLHDFGDPEASFTKEQMHAGKHQEYEKKLHDSLLARTQNNTITPPTQPEPKTTATTTTTTTQANTKTSKETIGNGTTTTTTTANTTTTTTATNNSSSSSNSSNGTNKENWPQLNNEKQQDTNKTKTTTKGNKSKTKSTDKSKVVKSVDTNNKVEQSKSPSQDSDHSASSPEIPSTPVTSNSGGSVKLPPHMLDDNSSFFSSNPFQKLTSEHNHAAPEEEVPVNNSPSPILPDVMPAINTSEDWAAAFGFARHSNDDVVAPKPFASAPLLHDTNGFNKGMDLAYNGFLLDMLSKSNGFVQPTPPPPPQPAPQLPSNGLDQNMSKFFMDFHKNNKDLVGNNPGFPPINGMPNNYYQAERIMLLQQKQLEEQFINLSMNNKPFGGQNSSVYQNGGNHYDLPPFGVHANQMFGGGGGGIGSSINKPQQQHNNHIEDELDFDPIQETQKAFAELMASEQNHKTQPVPANNRQQNGGYLPPPPPGFVQPSNNTHMNSFGSKILPFLNMSNNSSQIPNSSTQNSWSHPQHHKNVTNTCNDWKVLDPAILSSSRHYPLAANMPYTNHHQQQPQMGAAPPPPQLNSPQIRNYDFTNSAFSNFAQQLQQQQPTSPFNGYSQHINAQQNLNWFNSEINTNISSPPGFRNQTTKQQEC